MAIKGFAETLFEELDKRWARESHEMDRQQAAVERETQLQFQQDESAKNRAERAAQFDFTKDQAAIARQQQERANKLAYAQLLTGGKFAQATDPNAPGVVDLGGGDLIAPVSLEDQTTAQFEQNFKLKTMLADRFAQVQSGGDPERLAQIKTSSRYLRFQFGNDAVEPNVTMDQALGRAATSVYLDPKNGEPDPKGFLEYYKNLQMARAYASPSAALAREKYEDERVSDAVAIRSTQRLAELHQMSGYRAPFQELSGVINEIVDSELAGLSEERRRAIANDALRKVQMNQGGSVDEDKPPQTFAEAANKALLKNPAFQKALEGMSGGAGTAPAQGTLPNSRRVR